MITKIAKILFPEKTAGIFSSIIKYNLRKNKLGTGLAFTAGYLPNRKIGEGMNFALTNGIHIIPGNTAGQISEEMKKRPISSHVGNRDQISEKLRNIKQQ